jgi:HlyD family secretion protein
VLSLDVVGAKQGDPVRIYGPAIGTPDAKGTVARVYPAGFTKVSSLGVEQQRVKVIIHFDAEDLTRLRSERDLGVGYRVRVQITTAEKSEALVVPRSALFRGSDGEWRVYAIRDGRATIVPVEIGLFNDKLAEVVEGLAERDRVIVAPESGLEPGMRVKEKDEG